jgi:hypothetical protein
LNPWRRASSIEKQDRVGGIDDDASIPCRQASQCLANIDPTHATMTMLAAAASLTLPALIAEPNSLIRVVSDAAPRLFEIVAAMLLVASARAILEPSAPEANDADTHALSPVVC